MLERNWLAISAWKKWRGVLVVEQHGQLSLEDLLLAVGVDDELRPELFARGDGESWSVLGDVLLAGVGLDGSVVLFVAEGVVVVLSRGDHVFFEVFEIDGGLVGFVALVERTGLWSALVAEDLASLELHVELVEEVAEGLVFWAPDGDTLHDVEDDVLREVEAVLVVWRVVVEELVEVHDVHDLSDGGWVGDLDSLPGRIEFLAVHQEGCENFSSDESESFEQAVVHWS